MRRIKILIISSAPFGRVIEYLFLGQSEFEVVGTVNGLELLEQQDQRIIPDLILLNVKPVGTGIREMVASIKRYSPMSKVILTCPIENLSCLARECGAEAYLRDEELAGNLVRMARTLSAQPTVANT